MYSPTATSGHFFQETMLSCNREEYSLDGCQTIMVYKKTHYKLNNDDLCIPPISSSTFNSGHF